MSDRAFTDGPTNSPGDETSAGRGERELLRLLFDAMPQLGWTAQPDGFLDYYNRGWYEYTGTDYEAMKGWGWQSVHHPDELPRVMASWARSIATGKPWEIEFPLRRRDGVYRWFLSRATPIYDGGGALVRWVGINTDIDDQKRAEQKLAELDRAKTTFFSNVSHELRTPLTLLLGPLEDALRSPSRSLSGAALEAAQRNAVRLLKLVTTLLDFARIEAGRAQARYVATDIAALTRDLASSFESAVAAAGLRFEVDCAAAAGPVYVDHDMWEKVVLNLLSNALKFTFDGVIRVALRQAESHLVLTVSDTGTGIPEAELPHVFERFHRVHGARSRTHEGSGIGLALLHEIVRMHGGDVAVQSEMGRGTTFTVRIPLGQAHLPAERIGASSGLAPKAFAAAPFVQEALRWLPGPASATPTEEDPAERAIAAPDTPARARLLLADDNTDMREYLQRLLAVRWTVEAVCDGEQALAAARRRTPDLILSDVMMPNLDGFGLLRELRADPALKAVPLVMLSARADEEARIEGVASGADDYLVKPFSARELVARIAAQLEMARLRASALAERDKLHHLFVQSPVPVMLYAGPQHRFEFASPSYCEMAGRDDLVGKTVREAFPDIPPDHPSLTALDRAYATGQTVHLSEMFVPLRVPGQDALVDRWFNYVVRPLRDGEGPVTGLMVVAIEVTAQVVARRAVEAARQESERYRTLLETAQRAAGIGIFDWDVRSAEVYWSPELIALMGLAPGEVSPTPEAWSQRILREDMERGRAGFQEACAERRATHESEQRLLLRDGTTRWLRVTQRIEYDAHGEATRVIGAVVDIQNLRELAERERLARLEAEEANRSKDDFLALLGHELRNPLSPILTAIHLVRLRGGDTISREIKIIERQANHLVRLVDDLLDVSRIARGKISLSPESVETASIVAAAIETARPLIENGRHTLVIDIAKHGLVVDVDPGRMAQVIANLLTNAAKYTPPGGRITLSAQREGGDVAIRVRDNGSGISPELLPNVFELFVQARQTLARSQGGLGLGLAIVKSLVTVHGGTVAAESAGVGQGSTFTVRLPALDVRAVEHGPPPPPPALSTKQHRVLIVDDNQDAAAMLAEALRLFGYETAVAHDGPAGLRKAEQLRPDTALLDIGLPVMDGYELAGRLREQSRGSIFLVAITGYGLPADRQRALEAGFHEHLTKPVDLETLAKLLEANPPRPRR